jgi:hypothetical protein
MQRSERSRSNSQKRNQFKKGKKIAREKRNKADRDN